VIPETRLSYDQSASQSVMQISVLVVLGLRVYGMVGSKGPLVPVTPERFLAWES
jgi:hypothetical protein